MEWYCFPSPKLSNECNSEEIQLFTDKLIEQAKGATRDDVLLFSRERDGSCIFYFTSTNDEILINYRDKYNAQLCDEPSSARSIGESSLLKVKGNTKLLQR